VPFDGAPQNHQPRREYPTLKGRERRIRLSRSANRSTADESL
jgi:hypothetical protein